ncbi:N-acetyltransferase [Segetibacter sp. 3557_3]|uniref:GNAT family N-acetyltransferase n=1 Tax=Segetibacter sp. 3557_3 TaxID=2547429 RepID=UPI001058DBF0|nr:GNAT family protein [Segetibacter sp. 3557_3]TDH21444.1 N-acetyltransferase [Segetibacter sp. 3557_3]
MGAPRHLSVREIKETDIDTISSYWLESEGQFLHSLGVDLDKIPSREEWRIMLTEQLEQPYHLKQSYCLIWLLDQVPVGHSNVNKIVFGEQAYMHLHLWTDPVRRMGLGTNFIKMSLPYFFKNLQLQKLYCEPYALNPAPNKTLAKAGFGFVRQYTTTPGYINFEQPVSLWELTYNEFQQMQ